MPASARVPPTNPITPTKPQKATAESAWGKVPPAVSTTMSAPRPPVAPLAAAPHSGTSR